MSQDGNEPRGRLYLLMKNRYTTLSRVGIGLGFIDLAKGKDNEGEKRNGTNTIDSV